MTQILEAAPNDLIDEVAKGLKAYKEITPPEWAQFVKTGAHKERPPVDDDWWHVRAAAVLRSLYKVGPVGVAKLRKKYGGKRNRGVKPEQFRMGSGAILRHILQQLEAAGLAKQEAKGVHKGRVLTPKGISLLNRAAIPLTKRPAQRLTPKKEEKEPKAPAAEKKPAKKAAPKKRAAKAPKPEPVAEEATAEDDGRAGGAEETEAR
ncbi:30S ribosomal protein S19e [Candidatus Woesearchaeota archaeon]|nr:30S ribosomal protein S19e [Candidatus Woesearchaeota archaeon]